MTKQLAARRPKRPRHAVLAAIAALSLVASHTASAADPNEYIAHEYRMPSKARAPVSTINRCGVIFHTTPAPLVRC
jgi:hypothetical protein